MQGAELPVPGEHRRPVCRSQVREPRSAERQGGDTGGRRSVNRDTDSRQDRPGPSLGAPRSRFCPGRRCARQRTVPTRCPLRCVEDGTVGMLFGASLLSNYRNYLGGLASLRNLYLTAVSVVGTDVSHGCTSLRRVDVGVPFFLPKRRKRCCIYNQDPSAPADRARGRGLRPGSARALSSPQRERRRPQGPWEPRRPGDSDLGGPRPGGQGPVLYPPAARPPPSPPRAA